MATEPPSTTSSSCSTRRPTTSAGPKILVNVQAAIEKAARSSAATTGACARPSTRSQKRPDADYHLIQFHGDNDVLEQLDHTLKITDGVLRFRMIKLRAGTPAAAGPRAPPPPRPSPPAGEPDEA